MNHTETIITREWGGITSEGWRDIDLDFGIDTSGFIICWGYDSGGSTTI